MFWLLIRQLTRTQGPAWLFLRMPTAACRRILVTKPGCNCRERETEREGEREREERGAHVAGVFDTPACPAQDA